MKNLSPLARIGIKAALLFALFNFLYVLIQPLDLLNQISIYNWLVPGRARLPFADYPESSFNLTLNSLDQMIVSHQIARPKAPDEYRVAHLGDSGVWGYLLKPDQTQAACLSGLKVHTPDGRVVRAYNLGYPKLTVVKDLLILRRALRYQPDLIIWSVSLASLYPGDQLDFTVIRAHYDEVKALIDQYGFNFPEWVQISPPTLWDRSFLGQRRAAADWLRHQMVGITWAATGIDHVMPVFVPPHPTNLLPDDNVLSVNPIQLRETRRFTPDDLALGVIAAGVAEAKALNVPIVIINEPIYRSPNHDLRYNTYYPKWAFDTYREAMVEAARVEGWFYRDLWDAVGSDQFTDTDFHLRAEANCAFAQQLRTALQEFWVSP